MITKFRSAMIAKRGALGDEKGFTLIELLVVVLIIGVLAAIAVPIFLTQQDQAKQAGYKADLANAKIAYVSYVVDKGTAPSTQANLTDYGYTGSTIVFATGNTTTSFKLCIDKFRITSGGGVTGPATDAYTAATCAA